jgi:hypothetical protein
MNADILHIESASVDVQQLTAVGAVPGVAPLLAAARNGPGVGQLLSGSDGRSIAWRAPGSDIFGPPVFCVPDGVYDLLDGEDSDKFIRVDVYGDHAAAGSQAQILLTDVYNNALAGSDVTAAEAAAGNVAAWSVTLRNAGLEAIAAVRAWLDAASDPAVSLSPDGSTWSQPDNDADGVTIGSLAASQSATLYLQRMLVANSPFDPKRRVIIHVAFDGGVQRFFLDARGLYRIFNAPGYRFYWSAVGPPQEGSTPSAVNASLPYTPAATFADETWYFSVSYFNGVLDSGFLPIGRAGESYLLLTIAGGSAAPGPPLPPLDVRLQAAAGGVVAVTAIYYEDGPNRATQWAIAWTTDGSDPPASDPAATITLSASGLAVLSYNLPAATDGATVRVILQTRRNDGTDLSPAWTYSIPGAIQAVVAAASGPSAAIAAAAWPGELPRDNA